MMSTPSPVAPPPVAPSQPTGLPPFERVVQRHGATVLRVCRAVVGPDDADDAWSETFLAALRAYPELPVDANLEAWLVTIAHRKGIDVVRARRRRAVPTPDVDPPGLTDPDPFGGRPELHAALAQLTDRQRRSVAYHHVAGLSYAEVAQILGGSADAVRRAAADGMSRLRDLLAVPTRAASRPDERTHR
ncbi:MAG: RNA polymerase sigma factor [Propionibacteriaceae bacterium]